MRHGASKPVELPTKDGIEATPVRVSHESVQLRPRFLRARDPYIDILAYDTPATALAALLKFKSLDMRVLALYQPSRRGHRAPLSPFSPTPYVKFGAYDCRYDPPTTIVTLPIRLSSRQRTLRSTLCVIPVLRCIYTGGTPHVTLSTILVGVRCLM